ncbi:mCG146499, partial [Mus musculus]
ESRRVCEAHLWGGDKADSEL